MVGCEVLVCSTPVDAFTVGVEVTSTYELDWLLETGAVPAGAAEEGACAGAC